MLNFKFIGEGLPLFREDIAIGFMITCRWTERRNDAPLNQEIVHPHAVVFRDGSMSTDEIPISPEVRPEVVHRNFQ